MNIPDDQEDTTIVKSLIHIGHSMGLRVAAEGIENKQQFEYMKQHGCDLVQGYYFSVPLPENDMLKMLKKWPLLQGIRVI